MSLSLSPVSFLSEPNYSRRSSSKSTLHRMDYAVLMAALVVICGGCLFLMDLASAKSTGHESMILSSLTRLFQTVPAFFSEISSYVTLFLSSILTSGILIAFVCALRAVDQKISGANKNSSGTFLSIKAAQVASINQYKASLRGRQSSLFMISPVFQ